MDKLAEGGQFGTKDGHIGRNLGLAHNLPLFGRKRNYAYYANNVNYASYVKRCLTKFGGQNYETCNLS